MGPVWSWDDNNIGFSAGSLSAYLQYMSAWNVERMMKASKWSQPAGPNSYAYRASTNKANATGGYKMWASTVPDIDFIDNIRGSTAQGNIVAKANTIKRLMELCGENHSGAQFDGRSKCVWDYGNTVDDITKTNVLHFGSMMPSGIYPLTKTPLGYRAQCQHIKKRRSWWDWKDPFTPMRYYSEHKMAIAKSVDYRNPFPIQSATRSGSYGASMTHDNMGYQLMDDQVISRNNFAIMKRGTNRFNRPEPGYFNHTVLDTFNVKEKERIREGTTMTSWYPGIRDDIRSNYHFKADVPIGKWNDKTQDYIQNPVEDGFCPSGLPGVRPYKMLSMRRHSYPQRIFKEFVSKQDEGSQKPWYADDEGFVGSWHEGDILNEKLTDPRHQYKNEPWHDVYVCNRNPFLEEDATTQTEDATLLCTEPGFGGMKGFEYLSTTTFHNIPETMCRGWQEDRLYIHEPELLHHNTYNPFWDDPFDIIEHDHETNFWELSVVDDVIHQDWEKNIEYEKLWDKNANKDKVNFTKDHDLSYEQDMVRGHRSAVSDIETPHPRQWEGGWQLELLSYNGNQYQTQWQFNQSGVNKKYSEDDIVRTAITTNADGDGLYFGTDLQWNWTNLQPSTWVDQTRSFTHDYSYR